jgi:hypothetical protein
MEFVTGILNEGAFLGTETPACSIWRWIQWNSVRIELDLRTARWCLLLQNCLLVSRNLHTFSVTEVFCVDCGVTVEEKRKNMQFIFLKNTVSLNSFTHFSIALSELLLLTYWDSLYNLATCPTGVFPVYRLFLPSFKGFFTLREILILL